MNDETIEDIWKAFTETNRSFDGRISQQQMQKVFMNKLNTSKKQNKLCIMNEHIIEALFERFKTGRGEQGNAEKKIDI